MGKTPLLPQDVYDNAPYYGSGLCIPYYPLRIEENLFLAKTDKQAVKRVEVLKDGFLISNETKIWAQDPILIGQFLHSYGHGLYCFIVKTETNLNYSSRNIAEYVINHTSSSTDPIPPSIRKIDCEPCFARNEYQVKMQLADNDKICNVSLLYSLDENYWVQTKLQDFGNDSFSASLTFPAEAQKISLAVEASDRNGNKIRFCTGPVSIRGYEMHACIDLRDSAVIARDFGIRSA